MQTNAICMKVVSKFAYGMRTHNDLSQRLAIWCEKSLRAMLAFTRTGGSVSREWVRFLSYDICVVYAHVYSVNNITDVGCTRKTNGINTTNQYSQSFYYPHCCWYI